MIATATEYYLTLPPGRADVTALNGNILEPGPLALTQTGAQKSDWQEVVRGIISLLEMEARLIDHARMGVARALRERPVRQLEVARFIDRLQDERTSARFQLQNYLRVNFELEVLPEVEGQRGHLSSATLGFYLERCAANAAHMLLVLEQSSVYFFEAMAEAASKTGRPQLSHLCHALRFLAEERLDGLVSIVAELPQPTWLEASLSRLLDGFWAQCLVRLMSSRATLSGGSLAETVGFDLSWLESCLAHARGAVGAREVRNSALSERAHAA